VKEYLQFQDATSPSQLPISKVDALVKNMCLAWSANYIGDSNQAEFLYEQQVLNAVANGADELTAISEWMQQVQGANAGMA
ncbi:hypothetical protein H6G14_32495, partial [Nostoc parmelioides FACHB-3921]|nr:hypothetical protein [Nostoc parmelioides FACHB-3921]